jgi:general secretion pathway protein J
MMKMTRLGAFTLIEILVAMAIFSLIGLASTALLTSVLNNNEASIERFAELEKLQRCMLTMERDILQAVPRPVRFNGESSGIVLRGGVDQGEGEADTLGFVRAGWQNPQLMLPRSTLQLVAYRLQDQQLQRLYGNYLDNVVGFEPKNKVLLEGVTDFQVEFLLPGGDESEEEQWQESYTGVVLPSAIAITITSDVFGVIRREFVLSGLQR